MIDQNERVVRRREHSLARNRMCLRHESSLHPLLFFGTEQIAMRQKSLKLQLEARRSQTQIRLAVCSAAIRYVSHEQKRGAGCFAGPEFMRSLREEEPRMTNSSSPSSYRRSLSADVSKLTNRKKFEDGF